MLLKHPTTQEDSCPETKNYLAPNLNSIKVKKPDLNGHATHHVGFLGYHLRCLCLEFSALESQKMVSSIGTGSSSRKQTMVLSAQDQEWGGWGGSWAASCRKWSWHDRLRLTRMTVTDGGHLWLILRQLVVINHDCRARSSLQPTTRWILTETDGHIQLSLRKCDRQAKEQQHRDKNSQSPVRPWFAS